MRTENGVVYDDNNNSAKISWYGSEGAAIAALKTLVDCSDCSDCFDCSGCSGCSDCSEMAPQKIVAPVPVIPEIHKAVYAACSQPEALDMSDWHTCDTTHCRAGWVVHLAGEAGRKLEAQTTTLFAAQQIYRASGYDISPCRFFDTNQETIDDMRKLAEAN